MARLLNNWISTGWLIDSRSCITHNHLRLHIGAPYLMIRLFLAEYSFPKTENIIDVFLEVELV